MKDLRNVTFHCGIGNFLSVRSLMFVSKILKGRKAGMKTDDDLNDRFTLTFNLSSAFCHNRHSFNTQHKTRKYNHQPLY